MLLVAGGLAMAEWCRLSELDNSRVATRLLKALLILGLLGSIFAAVGLGPLPGLMSLALATGLAIMASLIVLRPCGPVPLGLPYLGLPFVALAWLRDLPEIGLALVLWLFVTVWASDIAAFAAGRRFGGPKLMPSISPMKTWSGFTGGVLAALTAGALTAIALDAQRPLVAVGVAVCLGLVTQLGDLFESFMKRRHGLKDSGRLLPGHGGLLDRIDGLLAASLVLALFHRTVGVAVEWW